MKNKASEIYFDTVRQLIETTTDSYRVISNQWQLDTYIREFGDVEVVYDCTHNVYRVPAFKEKRNSYRSAKADYCKKWGSG